MSKPSPARRRSATASTRTRRLWPKRSPTPAAEDPRVSRDLARRREAEFPEKEAEPLYGKTYLPRKFKIAYALSPDNCVDIFAEDVGLVAILEKGSVKGINVLVGGGMGMSHGNEETFPRLADPVAFISPGDVMRVVQTIVEIQRDNGDRRDRAHARLKYLMHDWGVQRFKEEMDRRIGTQLRHPSARAISPKTTSAGTSRETGNGSSASSSKTAGSPISRTRKSAPACARSSSASSPASG